MNSEAVSRSIRFSMLRTGLRLLGDRAISRFQWGQRVRGFVYGRLFPRLVRSDSFTFRGDRYRYIYHWYNLTWASERVVEVPIAQALIESYRGQRRLEVGNVLSHYASCTHEIVDKYEVAPGVINEDALDFTPAQKYDLIVSLSTLEHVGWDEEPRVRGKGLMTLNHLIAGCLNPGGMIMATIPVGYNTEWDGLFEEGGLPFTRVDFLRRVTERNEWEQAEWRDVRDSKYGQPFFGANAIAIGYFSERTAG
jgi:hypothetical protein